MGTVNGRAFMGLAANTGKRDAAYVELEQMGKLLAMKKGNEAEEANAIKLQEEYYAKIKEEADLLLDGDRKAINEKAKSLQSDIKNKIRLFGGSTRKFMANGGAATISGYTRNVLESDELFTYKNNKTNLEKIIDAKSKGFGHLIAPQDEFALQNYNENGRGTITYSGLLNEIEIPASGEFDYGHRITPHEILYANESNKMKLLANFLIENPNRKPEEITDDILKSYIMQKGYSGKGTHESRYQNDGRGDGKNPSDYSEKLINTFSGSVGTILDYQKKVPIDSISDTIFELEGFMDGIIGNNFESKWDTKAEQTPELGEALLNLIPGYEADNTYMLRGARKFNNAINIPAFKAANGKETYILEGDMVLDFDPQKNRESLYYADGTQDHDVTNGGVGGEVFGAGIGIVSKQIVRSLGSSPRNVKILGSGLAWESIIDGKSKLIVNANYENGEFDEERTGKLYHTEDGHDRPDANPVMFIMMETETAAGVKTQFYQKANMTGLLNKKVFEDEITSLGINDLSNITIEEQQKKQNLSNSKAQATTEETVKESNVDQQAFASELFKMQNRNYNINSSGTHREALRRAFYLTVSEKNNIPIQKLIEEDYFQRALVGLNLFGAAKSTKINDKDLLIMLSKESSIGEENPSQDSLNMMLAFLNKINNPQQKK
jgi:hypothetical protein